MTDHVKTQIRDEVARLLTGLATTGNRVYPGRVWPLERGHKPALLIYTDNSETEVVSQSPPRTMSTTLELQVQASALAREEDIDALLDTIEAEVAAKLGAASNDPAEPLKGLIKDLILSTAEKGLEAEAETPVGALRLTFLVEFSWKENDPTVAV